MTEQNNIIELIKKLKQEGISDKEYKSHVDNFLESKARKQGIPLTGSFELTPVCNLDCKMCYVHLNSYQFDNNELLSVEVWKNLIIQAYEAGMRNASLTGGECLTYPGFDDVYLYLYSLGIMPNILSNGLLIDEKRIQFFKDYPPRMIQVTVYGSSDDAYEKVTGHRAFKTVYNNLVRLKEEKIPVKLSITPNSYMRGDAKKLLDLLQSMEIPYNINANLISPRNNTGRSIHDLSIDEYVDIFKYRTTLNNQELTPVDLAEIPDVNHKLQKKYGFICGAGRSAFGIKYDGNLCPCLSMDELSVNARDMGFIEAWKIINDKAKKYPIPEECSLCVYRDRCLPCIAMHMSAGTLGHCNPRICERTKKLTSAGFIPVPEQ